MCVIIIIPQGETITKDELRKAWNTNPDGAGYATLKNNKVMYHRGFMDFHPFYREIQHKIGREDIILHFRITTSNTVNRTQTHGYELGNKKRLKGITSNPVLFMNGVISGYNYRKGFNDTMEYIDEHSQAFRIINDTGSADLLDIIEDATGSRWAMLTTEGVIHSHGFTKQNGRYYSNTNHLFDFGSNKWELSRSELLPKQLNRKLNRKENRKLRTNTMDFIKWYCNNGGCWYCDDCITGVQTLNELEEFLNSY